MNPVKDYEQDVTCLSCFSVWRIDKNNDAFMVDAKLIRCPLCSELETKKEK